MLQSNSFESKTLDTALKLGSYLCHYHLAAVDSSETIKLIASSHSTTRDFDANVVKRNFIAFCCAMCMEPCQNQHKHSVSPNKHEHVQPFSFLSLVYASFAE